ncbi:MAG: serine/threonine-protein kinase [Bradymonadaceae bacterium]
MADRDELETLAETLTPDETRPMSDEGFDPASSIREGAGEGVSEQTLSEAIERLPRVETRSGQVDPPELEMRNQLGEGGAARVLNAFQFPVGREVAVKEVREESQGGTTRRESELKSLLREAWITGYLEHPNVVPIYRVARTDDGEPVIVMKRIEGVAWSEVIRDFSRAPDHSAGDDPLQWHVETLIQVCRAVEYAHDRGIVHRDLKPQNVMVGDFGEVYVVDWGIAAAVEPVPNNSRIPRLDDVETAVGTPAFMPPEMIEAETEAIGRQSDLYLLGGILHEVLTGRPPHDGDSMIDVLLDVRESGAPTFERTDVPDRLAAICRRALEPDPEHRHPDVSAFREELQDYARHRESMAIVDEAKEKLGELERRLRGRGAGYEDETELREAFAECRFGFEQALEISESNQ